MTGWSFRETMTGHWTGLNGRTERQPLAFSLDVAGEGLRPVLFSAAGTINAASLATYRRAVGKLIVSPLVLGLIRYELGFAADDGRWHELIGQKDVDLRHPYATLTRLPFTIRNDSGDPCGQGEALIRGPALKNFLLSFRPHFGR